MNTIFTTDEPENYIDKINLDELYEKKRKHDITTTNNYKTILNRVHNKIKNTSRQQLGEQYCWFIVPEMMIGVPKYDSEGCIAYIIDKLQENCFKIRYTHPNMLFISWQHWVPEYVRNEIKKKTGVIVDGTGKIINKDANEKNNDGLFNNNHHNNNNNNNNNNNTTKSINTYKPTGQLIYNNEIINSIKNNFNK